MEEIPQKVFRANVALVTIIVRGKKEVRKITFTTKDAFSFAAGQYVWIEMPTMPFADVHGNRRAFSVCHADRANNTVSILVRSGSGGYKKSLFALGVGADVVLHGPFGSTFTLTEPPPKNLVMIAGGVGVAPFLSILYAIKERRLPVRCFLLYLNTDEKDAPSLNELEGLKGAGMHFDYVARYQRFSWKDVRSHVSVAAAHAQWWISGPQAMVDHVAGTLAKNGVASGDMRFENFYPTRSKDLSLKKMTSALRQDGILVRAIEGSPNHTIFTDPNGTILFANDAAVVTTGYAREEMIGHTPRLWGGMMSPDFYANFWKEMQSGRPVVKEITNRRKNGDIYYTIAHVGRIAGDKNETIGYVATEEDITEIRKQDEKIRQLNTRFDLATRSVKVGVWEWNLVKHTMEWNDVMFALYGLDPKRSAGPADIEEFNANLLHSDDRERIVREQDAAIRGTKNFDTTFRVVWKDGSIHHLRGFGIVEKDATGRPVKMAGVNWDITKETEMDQAKSEFVSLASHQLRTPLTAINWYAEMLLAGDAGKLNKEQKKFLDSIFESNQRMITLVNAFLNVSRLEIGTYVIKPEPIEVEPFLASVIDELQAEMREKSLKLTQQVDGKPLIFLADRTLLRMVFQNLISTAIKYTPKGGSIDVRVALVAKGKMFGGQKMTEDRFTLAVADTGIGIPKEQQAKIFSRFFRAANALRAETDGSGLGLYIIKSIIDRAGGALWFASKEGQGTTFYVSLLATGMKKKEA